MLDRQKVVTLDEFIASKQMEVPHASGELSSILRDIGLAAKIVNREVNKAGLVDILGTTGQSNLHGDDVKKLDVFSNEMFIASLSTGGNVCGIASEENEEIIIVKTPQSKNAKYCVAMDPLDGSSNIDVNVSIGTIFSIYRRLSLTGDCVTEDFLQKGIEQVAAGYVIYGSSTMMVYTTGRGVHGFTLDPSIGEFCLSHPDMTMPQKGTTYSINQGYFSKFPAGVKEFLKYATEEDAESGRPFSLRYIGSMVSDFHRNLIKGGIFMYPPTKAAPKGKLRLLYECNPLSFICEQAGGKSSNGQSRILDLQIEELHQRIPIYIGTEDMVTKVEELIQKHSSVIA